MKKKANVNTMHKQNESLSETWLAVYLRKTSDMTSVRVGVVKEERLVQSDRHGLENKVNGISGPRYFLFLRV